MSISASLPGGSRLLGPQRQVRDKIHCSQETADLIANAGHDQWLTPREDEVNIKGKGLLRTFFVDVREGSKISDSARGQGRSVGELCKANKTDRLIEWMVQVLCSLLRGVVARREAIRKRPTNGEHVVAPPAGETVLDEVVEIITLPKYDSVAIKKQVDPESIVLDAAVVDELF